MPFSAVDAISPAFEHTKRQLLQPFRFAQWIRLALVGLLAGELSSGGGCNAPNFNVPGRPGAGHFPGPAWADTNLALLAGLIAVLVVAGLALGLGFMYVSSVMRFVLFDSVLARECHIRRGWVARQEPGWRYFLWKLLYALVALGAAIVFIGIPAAIAFALGWFNQPKQHVVALVLGGIALFFLFAIVAITMAVIYVLTKDFVVPQMALENVGAPEGWRRLWPMLQAEKAGYAGYVVMKIVLAIGAAIILGIVDFILALIILVPAAGVVIATVMAAKAAGMGWTVYTITLAVVAACVLLAVFLFVTALISVPAIVFFPSYSIYFFAARYPALSAVLYPAPLAPATPQIPPGNVSPAV